MAGTDRALHRLLLLHLFNGLFSRTTWISRHLIGKPFWILINQEVMGWHHGSVISWTICKSFAPHYYYYYYYYYYHSMALWTLSRTNWVSRYQEDKTNLDFLEQEMRMAVASAGPYANMHLTLDT